jgi:hypothetical protein
MATDALEALLERDLAIANVRDRIEIAVPLIREVVNYGTMAFARCDKEPKTGDYHVPMFSLFLHQLEMTDAVELIVAGAAPVWCCTHARPLRAIRACGRG